MTRYLTIVLSFVALTLFVNTPTVYAAEQLELTKKEKRIIKRIARKIAKNKARKQIDAILPLGPDGLAANAVISSKIADGTVTGDDIADGTVDTADLANGAVISSKIADGAVTDDDIADDTITGAKIADGTVTGDDIADGAVNTADLADEAVISAKIADGTITGADIADGAIDTVELATEAVTTNKIMMGAVTTSEIANGAVTAAKLAAGVAGFGADCNAGLAANDVMVRVGPTCIDQYEASIWTARTGGTQITGAIPCSANGQDCKDKIFARSVAGVAPRAEITWFQALAALANSGKRLPSNAEWQMAVQGTQDPGDSPDPEDCNTKSAGPELTGERADCVSAWGTNDMVGNLWEWVADWVPASEDCPDWGGFSDDVMCLSALKGPSALARGGGWNHGARAGPLAVIGGNRPSDLGEFVGFRGAR